MRANTGFIFLFMTLMIAGILSAFYFLIFANKTTPAKRAVICKNDGPTISLLINEEENEVIMMGDLIDSESIKIFNEAAISAEWSHQNNVDTKIFLDRIAGLLDVEVSKSNGKIEKQQFECTVTNVRF